MDSYTENSKEDRTRTDAKGVFERKPGQNSLNFWDNRPEAATHKQVQEMANNSNHSNKTAQFQAISDNWHTSVQKKENKTGLPDTLKSGIENLSGYAMDDVKVHYNSNKPEVLQAHAYAQGTNIHLGAGQEKYLPHEAWHVVQQKQGRVKPTLQMKGKVNVNADKQLEGEADIMGAKAARNVFEGIGKLTATTSFSGGNIQRQIFELSDTVDATNTDNGTVQRFIMYNSSNSSYETNGDRPGWLKVAEDSLLDEYNIRHELSVPKLEYAKEKLDRCHIVAFEDIQIQVALYLNDPVNGFSDFDTFVNAITAHLTDGGKEKQTINTHFKNLIKKAQGTSTSITVKAANTLLSRLNSISENLRAGNKYINSYIGQNLDLLFQQTSSGKYQLTDHSRHILTNVGGSVSSVLRTPDHKSRLVTSEGPIGFGDMTPRSQKLTEDHPFETRNALSDNVRGPLYKSTSQIPVKGYKKALSKPKSQVHPLILTLQPEIDKSKIEIQKLGALKLQTNININLARQKITINQYDKLVHSRGLLNQYLNNINNEYYQANSYVQEAGANHAQNIQSIQILNLQKDNALQTLQHTSNVSDYEHHQQIVSTQTALREQNNPAYNYSSHLSSYNEVNRLTGQQDVINYYSQQQQIATLNSQISNLENLNSQIERNYQFCSNKMIDLNLKFNAANQQLGSINIQISNLESTQDVVDYNSLFSDIQILDDLIAEANYDIISMRKQLSQI